MNGGFNFFNQLNFGDLFGQEFQQQFQHNAQQQPQRPSTTAPPASKRLLRNLPAVKVTADDLIEETNKNCCVCLEDQLVGTTAIKLPCGHIYHPNCLREWLEKSCTCPVCRFELETDDPAFEEDR